MKKIYIMLTAFVLTLLFVGCTTDFNTTTTASSTTAETTTLNTDGTTINTSTALTTYTGYTTSTVDISMVISEVYQMIYEDLYDAVKAEVIQNISEERFDQIYQQVLENILDEIIAGNIEVSAASVIDMIYQVEQASANAVIGVIAYDVSGNILQTGSGVIYKNVGDKYYVVTNFHVVENGITYEICFADGSEINATLLGVDDLVDVAVLSFMSDLEFATASFGDSTLVQKGDIVLAVGNPQGFDFFGSMTMGIVSGLDRFFDIDGDNVNDMFVNYIQHDAAINSGNSGGALFNLDGEVIGINVIKISATEVEGMGFAIPSNLVSAICSDIEEYGVSLQKPVLGINFLELRGHIDYLVANGAVIPNGVTDGFYIFAVVEGASFDGYVQPGDIIVSIADIELTTAEDFVYEFQKYKVGDTISISLYRNGNLITIDNILLKAKVAD